MNNLKTLLVGHMSPRAQERNNAAVLRKKLRDHIIQPSDRPFGSYVLVNVPSEKERHKSTDTI